VTTLTADEAWKMLDEADLVVPEADVEAAIAKVAADITVDYHDRYPLVLSVMNGAMYFCARMMPLLRFPLHLDYVHASRYGDELEGRGVRWKVEPQEFVKDRHVLVVDDILDVGETLAAIKAKVLERGAASCRVAVLADKRIGRPKPVTPDFVGVELPDRFVFGCGLDAHGSWRNLPAIYAVKDT
jgi:hypoxanthine phosphoribosyltransferase